MLQEQVKCVWGGGVRTEGSRDQLRADGQANEGGG